MSGTDDGHREPQILFPIVDIAAADEVFGQMFDTDIEKSAPGSISTNCIGSACQAIAAQDGFNYSQVVTNMQTNTQEGRVLKTKVLALAREKFIVACKKFIVMCDPSNGESSNN